MAKRTCKAEDIPQSVKRKPKWPHEVEQ